MECRDFEFFVHAYVDGEFDDAESAEYEAHLAQCADCRRLARHELLFRQQLKASYVCEVAPDTLKDRIRVAIADQPLSDISFDEGLFGAAEEEPGDAFDLEGGLDEDAPEDEGEGALPEEEVSSPEPLPVEPLPEEEVAAAPAPLPPMVASSDRPRSLRRRRRWSQERLMVAVMVVASLGLVGTWGVSAWQGASEEEAAEEVAAELDPEPIVEEAVNWHRRDLPVDVVGPSDKRVKRWFDGKVNFPVRLPRFDRERPGEVNLLGARLSNVRDRQAAYVVYEANGSKLSVMVFNRNPRIKTIRRDVARRPIYFKNAGGYNVAVVEDNGVTYSITSELPEHEMVQLVDAAFKEGSR